MVKLILPAEIGHLQSFLDIVEGFAKSLSFPASKTQKLVLIMEEALLNVVNHAYGGEEPGPVEVRCWEEDESIMLEIRDKGRPFNPVDAPDPDLTAGVTERPIGGLGIFLIKKIADEVKYRREKDENILTMIIRKEA
ncbi:MAG: ATP-binding protein [Thermodesulforhabdaceae bacterium]